MRKIDIQPLFQISGISSASGLIYKNGFLIVISDNSNYLYKYIISQSKLNKIALFKNSQENISKKGKSDFESITLIKNNLYIFGSGSTSNRNHRIKYNLKTKETSVKYFTSTYNKLKKIGEISDTDLNIEGAFYCDKKWYYFQRGNGEQSINGIYISEKRKNKINFFPILLPKIKNIEATFTDAVLLENHIYFLAAVENTISTYDDGEILGCFIGCLSLSNLQIVFTQQISDKHKFEGLTLYKESDKEIEFLLCEDNDTDVLETIIYKLILSK